ncbi:MAG: hypothetical protein D6801_10415, partial [Alphaproteobacteria bacterium]
IEAAAPEIAAFFARPERLVLRVAPDAPVRLSEEMFNDPAAFSEALAPVVVSEPLPPVRVVTAAEAAAADAFAAGDRAALTPEAALEIARAFLEGVGAPRDAERAIALLDPLIAGGNAAAAALALDHLDTLAPEAAYTLARRAAAGGETRAFARLDGLERRLGLAKVLALQAAEPAPAPVAGGSPFDAREAALAALTGLGTPRSYAVATEAALIALAGGDRGAETVLAQIEAIGRGATGEDAAAWEEMRAAARARANASWFARAQ